MVYRHEWCANAYRIAVRTRCFRRAEDIWGVTDLWAKTLRVLLDKYKCSATEWISVQFDGMPSVFCQRVFHCPYPPAAAMITEKAECRYANATIVPSYREASTTIQEIDLKDDLMIKALNSDPAKIALAITNGSLSERAINRLTGQDKIDTIALLEELKGAYRNAD